MAQRLRPGIELAARLVDPELYLGDPHPLYTRLRTMMAGPDFAEGVAALAARRPPHFADLPDRPGPTVGPGPAG